MAARSAQVSMPNITKGRLECAVARAGAASGWAADYPKEVRERRRSMMVFASPSSSAAPNLGVAAPWSNGMTPASCAKNVAGTMISPMAQPQSQKPRKSVMNPLRLAGMTISRPREVSSIDAFGLAGLQPASSAPPLNGWGFSCRPPV
jgi:hypothetical protein